VGSWSATEGYAPPRRRNSAHPSIVPFQNFATADGWIVVACPKQKFWELLCDVLGHPELVSDPRFLDFAGRDRNRDELLAILDAAFATRGTAAWLEALAARGVPSAPVNGVHEALLDPQVEARGGVVEIDHPRFGTVRQLASPLRVGEEALRYRRAPSRGEDTVEALVEICGYSRAKIAGLADAGVFGAAGPAGS
jgi:crotonobetainyl-CoA:carnitine CoA-transferase CaiB-like acyl-CoA transferase